MKKFYNTNKELSKTGKLITRIGFYIILASIIVGCASIVLGCASSSQQKQNMAKTSYTTPPPPPSISQNTPSAKINLPLNSGGNQQTQSSNPKPQNSNSINSNQQVSSNNNDFQRIEEKRSYGGMVTEVKVNNRGDIPPYYIYPNQQQYNNTNNPDKLITPTWKISW